MKMKTLAYVLGAVVTALAAGQSKAQDLKQLKVRMDFQYQGYQAPFFVAQAKGYYKDAGLKVELLAGQGSGNGLKSISSGAEQFGLIDAGVAALGISKGAPVRVVAGYIQQNPNVVISRKSNPINAPKDMIGKSIVWPPGIASGFMITAMWNIHGIDPNSVKKISTTLQAATTLFVEGKADSSPAFINAVWAVLQAQGHDKDMQIMKLSEFGVNALSLAVVANTSVIDSDPETVKKFVAATLKGLDDVVKDPESGWKAVVAAKPEVDPKVAQLGLENSLPFLRTTATKDKPLGWMAEKDWTDTLDFLEKYMELSPRLDTKVYYTNDFLP